MKLLVIGLVLVAAVAQAGEKPRFRLSSEALQKHRRSLMPQKTSPALKRILDKPLVFYVESEMPPVFQHDSAIYSTSNNISATAKQYATPGARTPYPKQFFGGYEPFGNANREFPWGGPAGTQKVTEVKTLRFVDIPGNEKIKYWRDILPGDRNITVDGRSYVSYKWEFPEETTFGEVIFVSDSEGYDFVCEIRTRVKTNGAWVANVYRPFPTKSDLMEALAALPIGMKNDQSVTNLRNHLTNPPKMEVETIKNEHPTAIFEATAAVDNLPQLSEPVVKHLLTTTEFKSALDKEWVVNDKQEAYAPSTNEDFHIVPKGYRGSHVAVNNKSCMRCHNTCLGKADEYQAYLIPPSQPNSQVRDWYGRVRGSDAIFSFHPFALESINYKEGSRPYPLYLRKEMVEAGILQEISKK